MDTVGLFDENFDEVETFFSQFHEGYAPSCIGQQHVRKPEIINYPKCVRPEKCR